MLIALLECKQSRPWFELKSQCPFPTLIAIRLWIIYTGIYKQSMVAVCKDHHHHHHHHVMLVARIYLTLSRHFSLSFIPSGRSSGQHPVSSHSCWMYVRAGRPAFARPSVGVHKSSSLTSSSLLLEQSGSSNLNSFHDRRQVVVQLVSCGVLPPGLV